MIYDVRHTTLYSYSDPVALCQNQAHLQPRSTADQMCSAFQLEVWPEPVTKKAWIDAFGNTVWFFSIEAPHAELKVTSRSRVAIEPTPAPNPTQTLAWDVARGLITDGATHDNRLASQFRFDSPFVRFLPEALDYATLSFPLGRPLLEAALDLTRRIFTDFKYSPATTAISTPTRDVFRFKKGVCQDFAHLQITCLRSLGLAARYVSGYLMTDPPPGQPKLVGADASHAWLSVYLPGHGWVDLDPTNNCIPGTRHVTLAWGRDYGDVCPMKGVFIGGGRQSLAIAVDVAPVQNGHSVASVN